MKQLVDFPYGFWKKDRNQHKVTEYLNVEYTHAAIFRTLFKKLNLAENALYEVDIAKAKIDYKEPIFFRFFELQKIKIRFLEPHYNFFTKFCDENKLKELEMDTCPLYLVLAVKEPEACIRTEMKAEYERLWSKDCTDSFTADAVAIFPPRVP